MPKTNVWPKPRPKSKSKSKSKSKPKSKPSHVTYTDFRERLAAYMDQVWDSRAPLHVTRQGGRAVVVISEEEFDGWMETLHLLRSPANARRLLASVGSANTGKLLDRGLIEP
jgi:antitoxin YefM